MSDLNWSSFLCHMCGHVHDVRDELLALPDVCGWCGDGEGVYSGEDPA